ncbi:MAG TPA: SdpI family protein [Jiangellaceae bacterium]|nr:SdpI family protein [Jiangellaceae bacterium]
MDDVAIAATMLAFSTVIIAVPAHLTRAMSRAGTLRRNRAFGIKTRATLHSDHAWAHGHAAAEPWLLAAALWGYITTAGSAVLLVLGAYARLSAVPAQILAISGFLGTTALIIAGGVVGNSAARDAERESPDSHPRTPATHPGD